MAAPMLLAAAGQMGGVASMVGGKIKDLGNKIVGLIAPIGAISKLFGTLRSTITEAVSAYRPFAVVQFTRAVKDLQAVFGSIMLPAFREATAMIRSLGQHLYGLPAPLKDAIREIVKLGLITGAITALAGLATAVAVLVAPIQLLVAWYRYLYNAFSATAGGAKALSAVLDLGKRYLMSYVGMLQAAWNATAGIRAKLSAALSELGSALSDLFDAVRPLLAGGLGGIGLILKGAITILVKGLMLVVNGITAVTKVITKLIGPLGELLKSIGVDLPAAKFGKRDNFGLGWGGGGVSDPMSVYNKLTEEILRNSRTEKPAAEQTADATKDMAGVMNNIKPPLLKFLELAIAKLEQMDNGAMRALANPLGVFLGR